ncbi:ras guanine nucleotide exchange factor domain-containing protein [Abortiporus biennis]|nr:ras guanine nucleotide exchange factor domain-containing protein [Abortiporus biennis]
MTASSSPFNESYTTDDDEETLPQSHTLLTPPPGLRKSISVDSFVGYRHPTTRSSRGNSLAAPPPAPSELVKSISSSTIRNEEGLPSTKHVWPTSRSRGASISTVVDQHQSFLEESDVERTDDLRRGVSKGKKLAQRQVPEGELTLPSRLQAIPPIPTSAKVNPPIVPERGSSLSQKQKLPKQRSLIAVNTHISGYKPEVTIAVIGGPNSGKSSAIRKGLKGYTLSDPTSVSGPSASSERIFTSQYSYRLGKLMHVSGQPDTLLRVLEIDAITMDLTIERSAVVGIEPSVDGIVVCYDVGSETSFEYVKDVLRSFDQLKIPSICLACKSDLEPRVNLDQASSTLKSYDIGLVQASAMTDHGKVKIRNAFEFLFTTIFQLRSDRLGFHNPASPALLNSQSPAPWEISRADSATPTASSSMHQAMHSSRVHDSWSRPLRIPPSSPDNPSNLGTSSPSRARSMNDLLSESELNRRDMAESDNWAEPSPRSSHGPTNGSLPVDNHQPIDESLLSEEHNPHIRDNPRESRAPPWVTIEELLDKLLFLAVSDDDPSFISHFLLTYRRFSTPRSILLAMQKRMRALDQPTGDPMFACFAQMKICSLLDTWMKDYREDFAVPGTSGALSALVKSIVGKTYLLHYGSDFIPFMEMLPTLKDQDASWAMKVESPSDDSDDGESVADAPLHAPDSPISTFTTHSADSSRGTRQSLFGRERKSSLPLSSRNFPLTESPSPTHHNGAGQAPLTAKQILKKLQMTSQELNEKDPSDIAREITREEAIFFLLIKPRHWLQHVLGSNKKQAEDDPITKYNKISNHIAHWVLSLILCHDKPKARARQIEKFVDVANRLRMSGNYSALRAVVAGINGATYEGDISLEIFRTRNAELWKSFQSFDQLLQAIRSHQKYRMALKNTKGACIPALEIHLSDLIRAHEGNPDFHDDDPTKIHWAKFNMMGRFIDSITQCQKGCLERGTYDVDYIPEIYKLLLFEEPQYLMDEEMQRSRTDLDSDESSRPGLPRTLTRDYPAPITKDGAILRKIFFW